MTDIVDRLRRWGPDCILFATCRECEGLPLSLRDCPCDCHDDPTLEAATEIENLRMQVALLYRNNDQRDSSIAGLQQKIVELYTEIDELRNGNFDTPERADQTGNNVG